MHLAMLRVRIAPVFASASTAANDGSDQACHHPSGPKCCNRDHNKFENTDTPLRAHEHEHEEAKRNGQTQMMNAR